MDPHLEVAWLEHFVAEQYSAWMYAPEPCLGDVTDLASEAVVVQVDLAQGKHADVLAVLASSLGVAELETLHAVHEDGIVAVEIQAHEVVEHEQASH